MSSRAHWDHVYATKTNAEVSWTLQNPEVSLRLIDAALPIPGRVIDIGGGSSHLAGHLLERGHRVCVLDLSNAALDRARAALGSRADAVEWVCADVTAAPALGTFDLWHDRAAFHFLTVPDERIAYITLLKRTVPRGGHAIIATFALDGPEQCSGLPVQRYSGYTLARELGDEFSLRTSELEQHITPWGKPQSFQYSVFERR